MARGEKYLLLFLFATICSFYFAYYKMILSLNATWSCLCQIEERGRSSLQILVLQLLYDSLEKRYLNNNNCLQQKEQKEEEKN